MHAREIGLSRASDPESLARARVEGRACATLDRDFHAHLALASVASPSGVLLRWEGLDAAAWKDVLRRIRAQVEGHLAHGVAVTVPERTIRIRRLPHAPRKSVP